MRSKLLLLGAAICLFTGVAVNAQSYAITNAKIVTVSGATIDKGTIVVRNGLIESVGASVTPPADAQVFDATGLTVYPGFIDSLTSLGLAQAAPAQGRGGGFQVAVPNTTVPTPTSNSNYPAGLRPEDRTFDDVRPGESQFDVNRSAGFTTVLTVGRAGIFNGQSAVIDLAGDNVSAMVVRSPFAEHVSFNTIGGGQFPVSLLGTFAALRQMFLDSARLQQIEQMYATNPKGMRRPDADKSLEALFPIVNGKMPVVFNANSEREIIRAIDMIREFKLNGLIAGGQEAWKVADRLKVANIPVLFSLNLPKRTTASSPEADPEDLETLRLRAETPKGPGRLATAGVKFAFQSNGLTQIGDFFTNANKTVEGGLNRDAAIRAMTLGAAEILGVDDRLGSIEAGKIANLTFVKGDLFGKDKFVPQVVVDGKVFEIKEPARPSGGRGERGGGTGGPNGGGGQNAATAANVAGTYAITVDVPEQPLTATLSFIQNGEALTGTMVSSLGTTPLRNGQVTATGFKFAATVQLGGQPLEVNVSGTVNGNQITGTMVSSLGSAPFTGTRTP
jgi:imidazolonepropionase-like amidohydrolase